MSSITNWSDIDKSLFEIIVVNNNSTDNTPEIMENYCLKYPNIRVVNELKQGLSHSRNRGWREARGIYVAYIDDDARACPTWCERILHAFQQVSPQPVAVGGEVYPLFEIEPPKWFSDNLEIKTWGTATGFLRPLQARHGFNGPNMAFQKSILKSYGGFSTELGMVGEQLLFGEETEIFSRIYLENPLFWYDPSIRVYHWVSERKMRVSYRLRRSFSQGSAWTKIILHRYPPVINVLLLFIITSLSMLKITLRFLGSLRKPKRTVVCLLIDSAKILGRFGFLFGRQTYEYKER